jgi:hypothetical protein
MARQRKAPGAAVGIRDMNAADLARLETVMRDIECRRKAAAAQDERFQPAELSARAYVRAHRAPVSAAVSVAGADLAVIAAHAGGGPYAYGVILAGSAAAGARVAWVHGFRFSAKARKAARRRPRVRRRAAVLWSASSATAVAGRWIGVASGPGQAVMLAGGLAVAAPYLWHARKRPQAAAAAEPVAELPATDPRIEAFRERFGREAPCKGAEIHSARDIPDGFAFELTLAEGKATTKDVIALGPQIAALYDVPADQVTVEYTRSRSERRARISVLTTENAFEVEDRWDGASTYDPATGCIRLGRFADSADVHWMLHKPGSGAAGGVLAGVIGSGKTGTALVLACEAGLAKLCAVCGAAGTCAAGCDPRRIVAVWMGDPQEQPFGVFRGDGQRAFADLVAWGPDACVHMIIMAFAAMRARAAHFGTMEWTDHLGRKNSGKGSFDPTPEYPILYVFVDEWPLIVAAPDMARILLPIAAAIVKEGRKVGVVLVLLTQMPDLSQLGERAVREMLKAFNVLAHRTDGLSKHMLGIEGDTSALAPGVYGLGYINGADARPRATFRTKNCPDYVKPGETGIDVRELAEQISNDPVHLDDAILSAIIPLGWAGPNTILDGTAYAAAAASVAARPPGSVKNFAAAVGGALMREVAGAAPDRQPATTAARMPGGGTELPADGPPVYLPLLAAVLAQRGEMDLFDVSEAADVDAFEADRALALLADAGLAVQIGPGRYRAVASSQAGQ